MVHSVGEVEIIQALLEANEGVCGNNVEAFSGLQYSHNWKIGLKVYC